MQAVIIAAGKSTRTYPLTENRHKALLPLLGKPLLENTLSSLESIKEIDSVIIIVGHKKKEIMDYFGMRYRRLKLSYVFQDEQKGTGHALLLAENFIRGDFICLYGDDIYSPKDIRMLLPLENGALVKKVKDPSRFGVFKEKGNVALDLVEKPAKFVSDLANIGVYRFTEDIFKKLKGLKPSPRGEIELTDAVKDVLKTKRFMLKKVKDYWLPLAYPWDLLEATRFFMKKMKKNEAKGRISSSARVKGRIILGKGSSIEKNCVLEGFIVIGENCKIKEGAFLRDTIIFSNSTVSENCEVKESIIAENCLLGKNVKVQSRDKGKDIYSMVKGNKLNTGLKKLGCMLGDEVVIREDSVLFPGVQVPKGAKV